MGCTALASARWSVAAILWAYELVYANIKTHRSLTPVTPPILHRLHQSRDVDERNLVLTDVLTCPPSTPPARRTVHLYTRDGTYLTKILISTLLNTSP